MRSNTKQKYTQQKQYIPKKNNKVSLETIRRALWDRSLKPVRKNKLKLEPHREGQLNWTEEYKDGNIKNRKRVIWRDETKIDRIDCDGITYIWKLGLINSYPKAKNKAVKFGGGGMKIIVGRMESSRWISIFDTFLLIISDEVPKKPDLLNRHDKIFQQGNDAKFNSSTTKNLASF